MGLVAPGEDAEVVALTGGVSSEIAKVQTATRAFCMKRARARLDVATEWLAPVERSHAEVAWMKRCAPIIPGAVPGVLADDPRHHAFAMEFFDPTRFTVWKADLLAGRVDVAVAAAVGRAVAAVHAATADDPEVAAEFANADAFEELRLDPYFGEVQRRHPELAPALDAVVARTRATERALVHGDVSPKNVLVGDGRVVLLDAECATYGDPAFDLAFCLNHLLLKQAHRPASAADYAAAFDALAAAYLADVSWEPAADVEARAAALLPALLLARVDGKSPVEYLDEDARAAVRDRATRLLLATPTTLTEVTR